MDENERARDGEIRHARIQLPHDDYERLRRVAQRRLISVAAYIRLAVMERVGRDEQQSHPN